MGLESQSDSDESQLHGVCSADPGLPQVTRLRERDKGHLCSVRNRTPEISKYSLGEAEGVPR